MVRLMFHGCCSRDPNGIATAGFVLEGKFSFHSDGKVIPGGKGGKPNLAAYGALDMGLQFLIANQNLFPEGRLVILSDQQLVIEQLMKKQKAKKLIQERDACLELLNTLNKDWTADKISHEFNHMAVKLANSAYPIKD